MRVFGGERGQARNEEGNTVVITDYVPFFLFTGKQMEDLHRNHASGTGPFRYYYVVSLQL